MKSKMSNNMKITNLFKEKKKSYKRHNMKNIYDGVDSDDEQFKEFESHQIKNQKIKFSYPNQKTSKTQKTLNILKNGQIPKDIDSKSTQAFSKQFEKILEYVYYIKDDDVKNNNLNNFELSSKTKDILNKLKNKKKEEKQNKISNKENDLNLLLLKKEKNNDLNNKGNKIFLLDNDKKSKNFFKLDSIYENSKRIQPPKISSKTKDIMKKLMEERKNRFDRTQNNDENFRSPNSFSKLKFKYEELLSKPRELRLPIKYKQLYNAFISLEQTISLNKIREKNQMNTFDNIKNSIESITKHSFNIKILQQIIYVVPHFYILKYIKKKNKPTFHLNNVLNKDYDLIIEIPEDYNDRISKNYPNDFDFLSINYYDINSKDFCPTYKCLNINDGLKRKEIFKNILNRIVNVFHNKYLSKNNINIKFDPLKERTWEHNFDPDAECDDIPLFEIPLPPNKCSVFQETIMKNDFKNDILKDALSMINKSNEEEKNSRQNLNINLNNKNYKYETPKKNKYVSLKFLEKIRAKEKANNIFNEINKFNHIHNSFKDKNEIYKEIMMQIKTILIVNKKSMELNKISEAVLNSSKLIKDTLLDTDKISELICIICGKISNFISLKNHSVLGQIVVLENSNFIIPNSFSFDN